MPDLPVDELRDDRTADAGPAEQDRTTTSAVGPSSSDELEPRVRVVDKRWWARGDRGGEAAEPALKPSYVQELERRLAEKDAVIQSYLTKYREAAKEFEETRARLRRELNREIERDKRAVIADFLDVLDNLDRAIDAGRTAPAEAVREGVELVRTQFLAKLDSYGVTRIETLGQPFDPALHDAVARVAASDPSQDQQVVGVVRHGYRIGDEVLRPALVAVARLADEPARQD